MFSREWRSLFGIIIIFRITIIVCIPFDISGPVEEPQTKSTKLTTRRLRCQSSLDFSIIFFLSLRFILIPFAHFKPYVNSQIEDILQLNARKPNLCWIRDHIERQYGVRTHPIRRRNFNPYFPQQLATGRSCFVSILDQFNFHARTNA